MAGFDFWRRYLMLFGAGMILLGLAMLYLPFTGPMGWLNEAVLSALLGGATITEQNHTLFSFAFGLAGAATVGWGMVVFALAWKPLRQREFWAWLTLAASAGVWFAIDTLHVLQFGATPYAIMNLGVIIALDVALIATYRDCRRGSAQLAPVAR